MATHFRILARRISRDREAWQALVQGAGHDWATKYSIWGDVWVI